LVARRTGLTTHAIRVWERRYSAIAPSRTEGNRRLYSDRDVEKLRLLHDLTSAGHAISQVAGLDVAALRDLALTEVRGGQAASPSSPAEPDSAQRQEAALYLERCTECVRALDDRALERVLVEAHRALSLPVLLEELLTPLLHWVGRAWRFGSLRVSQEHLMTGTVRQFLTALRSTYRPPDHAPAIVVATLPGQQHELGALMAAAMAAAEGWDVFYLGANLPVDEIAHAVVTAKARAVALSIVFPRDDPRLRRDIEDLGRYLPEGTAVFVGGHGAEAFSSLLRDTGALVFHEFNDFRDALSGLRP
jgi:methanogenic corrinoid protein MtbC1